MAGSTLNIRSGPARQGTAVKRPNQATVTSTPRRAAVRDVLEAPRGSARQAPTTALVRPAASAGLVRTVSTALDRQTQRAVNFVKRQSANAARQATTFFFDQMPITVPSHTRVDMQPLGEGGFRATFSHPVSVGFVRITGVESIDGTQLRFIGETGAGFGKTVLSGAGAGTLTVLANLLPPKLIVGVRETLTAAAELLRDDGVGFTLRTKPVELRLSARTHHTIRVGSSIAIPEGELEISKTQAGIPQENWDAAKEAVQSLIRVRNVPQVPPSEEPNILLDAAAAHLRDSNVRVRVNIAAGAHRVSRVFPQTVDVRVAPDTSFELRGVIDGSDNPHVGHIETRLSHPIEVEVGSAQIHLTNVTVDSKNRMVLKGTVGLEMIDRFMARLRRWKIPVPAKPRLQLDSKLVRFLLRIVGAGVVFDTALQHLLVGTFTTGKGGGGPPPRHVFELLERLLSPMKLTVTPRRLTEAPAQVDYPVPAPLQGYLGTTVQAERTPLHATLRFEATRPNGTAGAPRPSAAPLLHFKVDQKAPASWTVDGDARRARVSVHTEGSVDCNMATLEDPTPTAVVTTTRLTVSPPGKTPLYFDVHAGWEQRDNLVVAQVNATPNNQRLRAPETTPGQFASIGLVGRTTREGQFEVQSVAATAPEGWRPAGLPPFHGLFTKHTELEAARTTLGLPSQAPQAPEPSGSGD